MKEPRGGESAGPNRDVNQMQHQPTKSTQIVNREWTPEERDQIATLAAAVNSNPLLSLSEKIDALIDLIRGEPQ